MHFNKNIPLGNISQWDIKYCKKYALLHFTKSIIFFLIGGEIINMEMREEQKSELTFVINEFQKPLELTKFQAWTQQILTILLMEPGSFPSIPTLGCGLNYQMFKTVDYLNSSFSRKAASQIEEYLGEIPFDSISFSEYSEDASVIILYIKFTETASTIKTVVVAMKEDETTHRIRFSDYFTI